MGYDEPVFNLCRMSNPATPGCDGPENEFARQGGITNGAAWYAPSKQLKIIQIPQRLYGNDSLRAFGFGVIFGLLPTTI
jgi:hypothetical protein